MSPAKCQSCGRFIALIEMATGTAKYRFEPDSAFGAERTEWLCERCAAADEDTLEWRLRYQSDRDHETARGLCLAGASEIARLNRLLDWCTPRLAAQHQRLLDAYRSNLRHPTEEDFLPIARGI